ncbi:hypothetical protein C8Q76DRAFT_178147 [Earliella scabrosa]|nr:hypothetical protein C8Q76DRAFT_178147 [Earliella scabrosa]
MNNSRLPVEICEHIIDSCRETYSPWVRGGAYPTWRETALVCSAWLPRSRVNLFHEVFLYATSDVDLLLRTLQEAPHFADLVIRLMIHHRYGDSKEYVPFARMPLPRLLKNCVVVDLSLVDWDLYPPRYADTCLYAWSRIVHLRLRVQSSVLRGCLRFIWSLRQLQYLVLSWYNEDHSPKSILPLTALPGPKSGKCKSLRSLELEEPGCSLVSWPVSAFGCSVTSLELDVTTGVSENTLQCIKTFRELERLTVHCKLDDPPRSDPGINLAVSASSAPTHTLQCVLGSMHPGSALLSVMIVVWPSLKEGTQSYGADRTGLLDLLLGDDSEILTILGQFSALRHFCFTLYENDPEYDDEWWTSEMVRRLPDSCKAAVSVKVRPWMHEQHLWHTQEEIKAAFTAYEAAVEGGSRGSSPALSEDSEGMRVEVDLDEDYMTFAPVKEMAQASI